MTDQQRRLLIRADANSEIGHGHVMRCLALAQAWQDQGGSVSFASRQLPAVIANRLKANGIEWSAQPEPFDSIADARTFVEVAGQKQAVALVVDGYHFDTQWQSTVGDSNKPLLVIDDYAHLDRYEASLLLNQNPVNHAEMYRDKFEGQLLGGPDFALLRREFVEQATRRVFQKAQSKINLLVTLGGSNACDITNRVLQAIESFDSDQLDVTLVSPLEGLSCDNSNINIVSHVDDMAALMAKTDLAICAGGSTNWELSLFGIPRLVIVLAENQVALARQLDTIGVCENLGWHEDVSIDAIASALAQLIDDPSRKKAMTTASQRQVDGHGARRVARSLADLIRTR